MSYTNTKEMLCIARKNNYAVGAYNVFNIETIKACVQAGIKANTPIIIQASESACNYAGIENLVACVKNETKSTFVPFALHLDHGKSVEFCKKVIDAGFSSVMIDLSSLPYEENIRQTKEVVDYAHSKNVTVEAELGELLGVEDNVSSNTAHLTDPKLAVDFINKTGVDSLAVSIGTAHGLNKGTTTPKIHFEILKELEKVLPKDFPLVCHGASSIDDSIKESFVKSGGTLKNAQGISLKDLHKMATSTPISKINTDTDIRLVFTAAVREYLNNNLAAYNPRSILSFATEKLVERIIYTSTKLFK